MPSSPPLSAILSRPPPVVILGTGEIASAIAVHLRRDGREVVLTHDPAQPVLRRGMAFHDALWGEEPRLGEVRAEAVDGLLGLIAATATARTVAVTRMGLADLLPLGRFDLLIDARLHKYAATPDLRPFASSSIGLGPGFTAGLDCDVAIETRPDRLGLLLTRGTTDMPDGSPPLLGGHGEERFVRAGEAGTWRTAFPIGARVFRDQMIGRLGRTVVTAPLDGILRGLVRDDSEVPEGAKLIEVDPRGRWQARWSGIDDRGRVLAEAVGEAVALLERLPSARAGVIPLPFPVRSSR